MARRQPIRFCSACGSAVEHREVFGRVRPVCPACGQVHFVDPKVAAGVVLESQGKVLLVRRSVDPAAGRWTVPGGFVEAEEDPVATAERECFEETGLRVRVEGLLDVLHGQEHPTGASIVILYRGRLESGELNAGDDADRAAFFGPDELPELAFEATRQAIRRWQAGG
jgi:ADP-ribose pyrophosphatase YjhB (NUDIX family)